MAPPHPSSDLHLPPSQIVIEARRITSMSYTIRQSGSWGRSVELPEILAVAGFLLACGGAGMLAIEVKVRGWWGFITSTTDLLVVLGLLVLSTLLSVWAFQRAEGWWRVLAFTGIIISMVAVAVLAILAALRLLVEFPGAFSADSNRQRRRRSGNRRRR